MKTCRSYMQPIRCVSRLYLLWNLVANRPVYIPLVYQQSNRQQCLLTSAQTVRNKDPPISLGMNSLNRNSNIDISIYVLYHDTKCVFHVHWMFRIQYIECNCAPCNEFLLGSISIRVGIDIINGVFKVHYWIQLTRIFRRQPWTSPFWGFNDNQCVIYGS